jgi:outer membrane receptor for ferrienterochelin and colicin
MKSFKYLLQVARKPLLIATAMTMALAMSVANVSAQQITSSVRGTVLQPDGQPAAGVLATITDSRDGARQSVTADDNGAIYFRSVSAGGPYTVRIDGGSFQDLLITDLFTDVAGSASFTVTLDTASASIEEIVVTAAQIDMIQTASGPSSTFSLSDITNMPSTTRQIRDIIRIDPRVSIGATGDGGDQAGSISCLGGSSRTNSFTIDGVRATDAFGLNASGNLARFTFPIPFDSVEAAAVEFAPVSVEYGQFSGCNINVVTKSGGNEFHGSGFYLYNDDGFTGDKINGRQFDQGTFERKNWGAEVSGPIIEDKLFFYASWEETNTATVNEIGPADDSSFPRNDSSFTTAEVNQIRDILINQYERDPGELVRNLPVMSERVFARLDWNINEDHRMEATYASLDEDTTIGDDIGTGRGEFTFSDNFHNRGSQSETLGIRLYSNWSDQLSTEVRWSTQEVNDLQNPVGGGEAQSGNAIPRIQLGLGFGNEFFGSQFTSGPGTFRSANQLSTNKDQLKIKADYQLGDHLITAGFEHEALDVFNLFIINATGTIVFPSIADLQAGTASNIRQGVSYTQDPNDAAAIFNRNVSSVFLQDQWDVNDDLQLIYGLRYDWYTSDDMPKNNNNYEARYGLTNMVGFDGLNAFQPRIGLNYTLPESFGDTRMNLGFGIFSGNDPTVWFSNAYQNYGGALGVGSHNSCADPAAALQVLNGGSFTGIPQCAVDGGSNQALATLGTVNATDPNFKAPTVSRYSFGIEHTTAMQRDFFNDWFVKLDLIYSDYKNSVAFRDMSLAQNGTTADGRPTYAAIDPLISGCNATFSGIGQGFNNVDFAACAGGNADILFTNQVGDDAHTFTASLQASKIFEWGDTWSFNFGAGYAYNQSDVANPGNSFTASGNYRSVATVDLQNNPVGPSYRNTPQNFTFRGTLSNEFIAGHDTSITAFFQIRQGHPISAVFNGGFSSYVGDASGRARNLLYIPTGTSDPNVIFDPGFDSTAFFAYVDQNGLARGAIQGKGGLNEDWQSDLDIRIQQEIPFFIADAKVKLFLDFENVFNLINDSKGTKKYINTSGIQSAVSLVDATIDPATNKYVFQNFTQPIEYFDTFDSLYRIQFGIRGEF